MTDGSQRGLDAYGDGRQPPILHADEPIALWLQGVGKRRIGIRGAVPSREAYGFYAPRESGDSVDGKPGTYPFAVKAHDRIRSFGCRAFLLGVVDTGTVYEFHVTDIHTELSNADAPVDAAPYVGIDIENARSQYSNHTGAVCIDL